MLLLRLSVPFDEWVLLSAPIVSIGAVIALAVYICAVDRAVSQRWLSPLLILAIGCYFSHGGCRL